MPIFIEQNARGHVGFKQLVIRIDKRTVDRDRGRRNDLCAVATSQHGAIRRHLIELTNQSNVASLAIDSPVSVNRRKLARQVTQCLAVPQPQHRVFLQREVEQRNDTCPHLIL